MIYFLFAFLFISNAFALPFYKRQELNQETMATSSFDSSSSSSSSYPTNHPIRYTRPPGPIYKSTNQVMFDFYNDEKYIDLYDTRDTFDDNDNEYIESIYRHGSKFDRQ